MLDRAILALTGATAAGDGIAMAAAAIAVGVAQAIRRQAAFAGETAGGAGLGAARRVAGAGASQRAAAGIRVGIAGPAAAIAASRNAGGALGNAALPVVTGRAVAAAVAAIVRIVGEIDADDAAAIPARRTNARAMLVADESSGTGRPAFAAAELPAVGTSFANMVAALP